MSPGDHTPRKRFGQNFLHDPGVIAKIVSVIGPQPGESLVEIGPGKGAITVPLLKQAGAMHVIELDHDLVEPLKLACKDIGRLEVINKDALRVNICEIAAQQPIRVVGNLPYNISTPLIFHLLGQRDCIRDMHFMLQKEVVNRLAAKPGGGEYGRLSVMVQYYCEVTPLFTIGAGAFSPAPRVESAFVRLTPYDTLPVKAGNEPLFAQLVRQAFSQRRKTLRNSLSSMMSTEQIEAAGIAPGLRAEMLSVAEFVALTEQVAHEPG
jgi:16S rRNA (adenine1518-N6/adenine1519-N6)-dimethyltransferase